MKQTLPALLTVMLMAGCASYSEQRVASDPVFRETDYVFPMDEDYSGLDMEERLSLHKAIGVIPRDSLKIATISTNQSAIAYSGKVHDLQVYLVDNGFDRESLKVTVVDDDVPLSLHVRYKLFPLPTTCPNWHDTGTFNQNDYLASHLGCSNALNISAMVADPSDLVKGKSVQTHNSETSVPAIQRYYAGQPPVSAASSVPADNGGGETSEGN